MAPPDSTDALPTPLVVGIDLGTTNSALAWSQGRAAIRIFEVPQLVAPGETGRLPILPSFLYLPVEAERSTGAFQDPWNGTAPAVPAIVGVLAREHGAMIPARQIASAKSWLVNASVDRTAPILPWGVEAGSHLSPVEASARILAHLRDAWNHERAGSDDRLRLEHQSIVLGVPASFDDEARELTVQAARHAGFSDFRVIEEPLAAVYAWIAEHRRSVPDRLKDGDVVLVCDVGGGTTDFTLIRTSTEQGELRFERIAIGEHLLLGGDNLDLALAVLVEQKMTDAGAPKLTLAQRQTLRRKCSAAKEQVLSDASVDRVRITLLGAGRGVVAGGVTAELSREEVVRTISDGFLPVTAPGDLPARDRRAGLRELGLPYESEPAITRHLAAFLARAGAAAGGSRPVAPDEVLFNGGFFAPALARARVLEALAAWFGERPQVLDNERPDAAVAIGAAFYGRLRQNPDTARRLLIRAGSARSYYVGVRAGEGAERAATGPERERPRVPDETEPRASSGNPAVGVTAVCVMPRGTQEGTRQTLDRDFTVVTNRPVAFTLYSTTQRADSLNDVVTFNDPDEVRAHAPLVTALRYGKRSRSVPIDVRLAALFTETGTLELWCESKATVHRWKLSFSLRAAEADPLADATPDPVPEETSDQVIVDEPAVARGVALIQHVFGQAPPDVRPDALTAELENVLGHGKHAWPLPVIRRLSDALLAFATGRRAGAEFEVRWLNLAGFCTRPGFGTPLDSWRVSQLRTVYAAGLVFPKDIQTQVEWLVLWQRVGAGFSSGQQRELAQRVMGQLGLGQKRAPRVNPQIEREGWRLLASLERLDIALRTRLGDEMLERLRREPRHASWLWAMGRLGSRTPLYGPLSSVVPPSTAERWIDRLLSLRLITGETVAALAQIGALTGDTGRDISRETRDAVLERLRQQGHPEAALAPLVAMHSRDEAEAVRVFGESLPVGLLIKAEA